MSSKLCNYTNSRFIWHTKSFASSVFCILILATFSYSAEEDINVSWDRYKNIFNVQNLESFTSKFCYSYPSVSDSNITLTRHIDLKSAGESYSYEAFQEGSEDEIESQYSWNGSLLIRHGAVKGHDEENNPFIYYLNDIDSGYDEKRKFENFLGFLDSSNPIFNADVISFNEEKKIVTVGNTSGPLARIYFTDIDTLEYSRFEFLSSSGNIMGWNEAKNWKQFGDIYLPQEITSFDPTGEEIYTYKIESFEKDVVIDSDFLLEIPYNEKQTLIDLRNNYVTKTIILDEELFKSKKYAEALDSAYLFDRNFPDYEESISDVLDSEDLFSNTVHYSSENIETQILEIQNDVAETKEAGTGNTLRLIIWSIAAFFLISFVFVSVSRKVQ